ncbi:F0F1 ATP synthase subunit alpha [Candidatus Saccharibacteria bacterium RIFCSPHIGHO2_12_FULL_47_17]|nr:MAG: F0F1 ATP synthase subunit alpha [Candidatus Saccharibacteria bacterium RIFCSPHIGHO2_12_FULL_47_17]
MKQLAGEVRRSIADLKDIGDEKSSGVVLRVGDGVAWIYGLRDCGFGELIEIDGLAGRKVSAFALNLMEDEIGAVLLAEDQAVKAGARVRLTGRILSVPVGPELIGRVIDPLGLPLDGKGPIKTKATSEVERLAPTVLDRKKVSEPVPTGIVAIDAMIPIGRGQRELIYGDRQTGKSVIAMDAIINQARQKTGIVSIYVAISQKKAKIARLIDRLKHEGAMDNTIIVATSPTDPAPLQYLAPYSGCAIGEWFRDNKRHALIVYDDLSKHAVAYRQMALLLRRPPGREAYPGDVFYLHSRLLERAAKLSDKLGGGSLTALPIIETQAGDVSAYIPTNVISITDGQIYLETDLFYQGVRPAISVGLSVSRVGGDAQPPAIKSVAGRLRLDLAQYRELAAFSQLASDLDPETQARLSRGRLLTEILKQPQHSLLTLWQQVASILAATEGAFDEVAIENVKAAQEAMLRMLEQKHAKLTGELQKGDKPTEVAKKTILQVAQAVAKGYKGEKK